MGEHKLILKQREGRLEGRFFDVLPTVALIALWVGAAGSVGFMLYAGHRVGAPQLLQGLFAMWVSSPFVVLAVGHVVSKRWSVLSRVMLCGATSVVGAASLAIYGGVAVGAPRPKTAVFVLVAPASLLLMAIVVGTAAFVSRQPSFRRKLSRVYELKAMLTDPTDPDAYFQNFETGLEQNASKLNAFVKLEQSLAALDDEAGSDLKERAAVHLVLQTRNTGRGWQALFDVLSEARGFGYLRSIDCTGVHFIKRTEGRKTPDLCAVRHGARVLCEVKTIHISTGEAERRQRVTQGAFVASNTRFQVGEVTCLAFFGPSEA